MMFHIFGIPLGGVRDLLEESLRLTVLFVVVFYTEILLYQGHVHRAYVLEYNAIKKLAEVSYRVNELRCTLGYSSITERDIENQNMRYYLSEAKKRMTESKK